MNLDDKEHRRLADELDDHLHSLIGMAKGDTEDYHRVIWLLCSIDLPAGASHDIWNDPRLQDIWRVEQDLEKSDEAEFMQLPDGQEVRMPRDA